MRLTELSSLLLLGAAALTVAFAACSEDEAGDGLCEAGEEIFCRCPGGDAGTKPCKDDGSGFGECAPCEERPSGSGSTTSGGTTSGTGTSSSSSTSSSGSGTGGAGGGTSTGSAALFDTCTEGSQCQSGHCPMGFCPLLDCPNEVDCGGLGVGECVDLGGQKQCLPSCTEQSDCDPYGCAGTLCSECGYTTEASIGWPVTVCADWGADLAFPPEGTECMEDVTCNLGHTGKEVVCQSFGVCAVGCYDTAQDCPMGTTCSSQGAIGTCNATSSSGGT
jgi:hypothetical protein